MRFCNTITVVTSVSLWQFFVVAVIIIVIIIYYYYYYKVFNGFNKNPFKPHLLKSTDNRHV